MTDGSIILNMTTVGISCIVNWNNNDDAQASVSIYVPG